MIAVVGPTACGKTRRGVAIARAMGGEIVSADSRQLYRGMDIGTGKDLAEYGDIPYHLIDVAPAGYRFNLFQYLQMAHAAIDDIRSRGHLPVVVGGTGLYVESLLKGLKLPEVPENKELRETLSSKSLEELTQMLASMKSLHNTTDVDTVKRAVRAIEIAQYYRENPDLAPVAENSTPLPAVIVHLDIDRDARRQRITSRLKARLEEGMVDEVRGLLDSGVAAEDLVYYGLEYKFVTNYVTGICSYGEMAHDLEIAIHQFAKRQATWFRGMERRGFKLHHIPYDTPDKEIVRMIKQWL